MQRKPINMHVMSIVHGKSEYIMCRSIRSNFRLKHHIHARNKGKNSIQVTSLMNELKSSTFSCSLKKFAKNYDIEYNNKKLVDFKLFIIMDLDDCTKEQANRFKDKSMFKNHPLYDYIVPIYNEPDLEKTMIDSGIEIDKKNKAKDYIKVFPTSEGDLDLDIAKEIASKLKNCKRSNLDEYFDYCISLVEKGF